MRMYDVGHSVCFHILVEHPLHSPHPSLSIGPGALWKTSQKATLHSHALHLEYLLAVGHREKFAHTPAHTQLHISQYAHLVPTPSQCLRLLEAKLTAIGREE